MTTIRQIARTKTSVAPTDSFEGQDDAGSFQILATAGLNPTASVTLSSAQILALHTSPITLVSAPGAGVFIYPLIWTFQIHEVSGAYTTGGTCDLYWGSSAGANVTNFQLDAVLSTDGAQLEFGTGKQGGGFTAPTNFVNQPIVIGAATNPTGGTNTVGISLIYTVLSAP